MVILNKIYTKTGDSGQTSLGSGEKILKNSLRVCAYGNVDEANACFGLARIDATGECERAIARIQNDLFDLGADLCRPQSGSDAPRLRINATHVTRLENEIDVMNAALAPLQSFILPGGSALSAALHLCRTVVRRAERDIVALNCSEAINPLALQYINRLSDWCFCAARIANDNGNSDILWTPGENA